MRIVLEVRYKASEKLWIVKRRDVSGAVLAYAENRADAVQKGRAEARALAVGGLKVELEIRRLDGSIGKGRGSRSSYPRSSDPRRRRG